MNEWYYSNADPADATQEVRNGGARLPVRDAKGIPGPDDGGLGLGSSRFSSWPGSKTGCPWLPPLKMTWMRTWGPWWVFAACFQLSAVVMFLMFLSRSHQHLVENSWFFHFDFSNQLNLHVFWWKTPYILAELRSDPERRKAFSLRLRSPTTLARGLRGKCSKNVWTCGFVNQPRIIYMYHTHIYIYTDNPEEI